MKRLVLSLAAGAAAFALAGQACAEVVDFTYQGTVVHGTDGAGLFGPANADLSGDLFTAFFSFDPARGGYQYSSPSAGSYGGDQSADTSPLLSASITINGVTRDMTTSWYGEIFGINTPDISLQYQEAEFQNGDFLDFEYYAYSDAIQAAVDLPQNLDLTPYLRDGNLQIGDTAAEFGFNSVVETVSGVPEPATWALMILGAGLIGLTARRQRQGAALAA